MRKSLILIAIAATFVFLSCKDSAVNKIDLENVVVAEQRDENMDVFPKISFVEKEFDFGEIIQGTHVSHLFKFTNTGNAPLVITGARSSCGCTIPEYTKEPIMPGEKGDLLVRFDGSGRGVVNKTITLLTNTEGVNETLRIKANVKIK